MKAQWSITIAMDTSDLTCRHEIKLLYINTILLVTFLNHKIQSWIENLPKKEKKNLSISIIVIVSIITILQLAVFSKQLRMQPISQQQCEMDFF